MKIGLCGAHRTGKTTLAKAYSEQQSLRFVETTTSSILESIGMNPKIHYPVEQRLEAQGIILKKLIIHWEAHVNCIVDRTPLDVLAYMEADILRNFPENEQLEQQYMAYRNACFEAVSKFDLIILVQPGIPIINEQGKAPGSLPYIEHLNSLMFGYVADLALNSENFKGSIMPRDLLDLQKRVDFIKLYAKE